MCGIVGFTHLKEKIPREWIERAVAALVHRGPDQQGCHQTPDISLGATRLKIIDLEAGDQPFFSEDGQHVLVFNGEIYNYIALREELQRRGHRFRTHCDTEVVLRAYLEWGRPFLEKLRGMFALAIWDQGEGKLLLARDRMGIKPLYYMRRGPDLFFASELKAILAHPKVERRLSLSGLSYYLSLNWVPWPYTLVEGIVKLPPAHWLEWQAGRVTMGRYWQLKLEPQRWQLEEAKAELNRLLRQAVGEHLVADVPVGVWSSGGLDSSTILHYAAEAYPGRLKTFSVSFKGKSFDETPYFRLVSSTYGTDHHEFDLNPDEDLVGAIEELAYYSDEPSADAGALPVWFLSKMCRRHVTVALSGEGADELFGGYITYLADRLSRPLRKLPRAIPRLLLHAARLWPPSDEKVGAEYKIKRFLAGCLLPADDAHLFWNGAFDPYEKQRLCRFAGHPPLSRLFDVLPRAAHEAGLINRYLWFDQQYYLPDDILVKCDRMSMAHSLEVRPAFLDHRIVEFAGTLPEDFKIRRFTLKYLLRELMRSRLPRAVIARSKQGFDIPAHEWFRGPLRGLLLDTLAADTLSQFRIFHPDVVQDLIRSHLERKINAGYHLWGLMNLVLWLNRWRIDTASALEASRVAVEGESARI